MAESACDLWDGKSIEALVSLEPVGVLRYRSRFGDANLNGRSYGGQILGQAMMAATGKQPLAANSRAHAAVGPGFDLSPPDQIQYVRKQRHTFAFDERGRKARAG
jgi:hypothetical protein